MSKTKEKKKYIKPELSKKNYKRAVDLLFYTTDFMDKHNIVYHLEGGTLLGIIRDNALLPWDYDVDISICEDSVAEFKKHAHELSNLKYKLTSKNFATTYKAMKQGEARIYKIKPRLISILKEFHQSFRNSYINIDIFVKCSDEESTYWQAKDKALKVDKKHYEGYDEVEFMGKMLKTPLFAEEFLESKYGDWKTPVKEWDCGTDEKTIVTNLVD